MSMDVARREIRRLGSIGVSPTCSVPHEEALTRYFFKIVPRRHRVGS